MGREWSPSPGAAASSQQRSKNSNIINNTCLRPFHRPGCQPIFSRNLTRNPTCSERHVLSNPRDSWSYLIRFSCYQIPSGATLSSCLSQRKFSASLWDENWETPKRSKEDIARYNHLWMTISGEFQKTKMIQKWQRQTPDSLKLDSFSHEQIS